MGKSGEQQTVFFMNTVYPHDSSADYGTDPKNPIQLSNIPLAYAYLDGLYFEDGTDAIFARVSTCHTDTGHTMDVYAIKHVGSDEVVCRLYFDCYVQGVTPDVPKGFYMKVGDRKIRPGESLRGASSGRASKTLSAPNKQGCLLPFVLTIGSLVAASVAICCALF